MTLKKRGDKNMTLDKLTENYNESFKLLYENIKEETQKVVTSVLQENLSRLFNEQNKAIKDYQDVIIRESNEKLDKSLEAVKAQCMAEIEEDSKVFLERLEEHNNWYHQAICEFRKKFFLGCLMFAGSFIGLIFYIFMISHH